jgi:hypothetical protein
MRLDADLRTRWRALLGLALLLGRAAARPRPAHVLCTE